MDAYRVGYIGIEHHHRDPYFAMADTLPIEITAICEPDTDLDPADIHTVTDRPDEIGHGTGDTERIVSAATYYHDPADLLADGDIDLCWITYSNAETPNIVARAIDAGIDVISEKPMARTAADLEPLVRKATDAGISVVPTYFYRGNPIVNDLRSLVRDEFFGDLRAIQGRFIGSQLEYRNTDHYIYDATASRGGVLQWIGVHWLDTMCYILDSPIVRVNASMSHTEGVDVEDGAVIHFETAAGTMGTLQTGYYLAGTGKDTHLSLFGRSGQAWSPIHHDSTSSAPTTSLELLSQREGWKQAPKRTTEYEFGYELFPAWGDFVYSYFASVIDGLETNDTPATIEDALRILEILDAAYTSAESDGWVSVPAVR